MHDRFVDASRPDCNPDDSHLMPQNCGHSRGLAVKEIAVGRTKRALRNNGGLESLGGRAGLGLDVEQGLAARMGLL